jgi:hypothetical protein
MLQSAPFKILANNNYTVNETTIDMGTWEARAIINAIRCGNLVLNAPFQGVEGPSVYWIFVVGRTRIISIGAS